MIQCAHETPKRLWRWGGVLVGGLALLLVLSGGMFWWALKASLAQVDGCHTLPGLNAPVQVERDHLGVPTIHEWLGRRIAGLSGGSFSGRVGMR